MLGENYFKLIHLQTYFLFDIINPMAFIDPKNNIEQFGLSEGMRVADLGSGSGFYVIESSKVVGGEGRVYAVDVQKDLLEKVKASASLEGLNNIEIIWGDIEKLGGTKLADASVDAVIISNTLFQVEEKDNLLIETGRILRPNGRVLVVDWTDSFNGLGPAPESVFTGQQAKDLFQKNGFVLDKEISAGEHHYGFILKIPRAFRPGSSLDGEAVCSSSRAKRSDPGRNFSNMSCEKYFR